MATTKKRSNKGAGGRPSIMTKDVVNKLEIAYTAGANDTQACDFADISRTTLYKYINEQEGFANKIEQWKQRLKLRAKMNIQESINDGDRDISRWYLEKTDEAFNPKNKQELTGKDGKPIEVQSTVQIYLPDNQREDKQKE